MRYTPPHWKCKEDFRLNTLLAPRLIAKDSLWVIESENEQNVVITDYTNEHIVPKSLFGRKFELVEELEE